MGLFDVFSKGGKYFGKAIEPKCEYCESGKRAKDGDKVLCEKKGLVDAGYHCPKFVYSPLKRIPEKQMSRVGFLEGDYDEKEDRDEPAKSKKHDAKGAKSAPAPAVKPATAPTPASAPAPAPAAPAPAAPAAQAAAPAVKAAETAAAAAVQAAAPAVQTAASAVKTAETAAATAVKTAETAAASAVKPAVSAAKPVLGGYLAALAAMADAAGEYQPHAADAPADAPETPASDGGAAPTLSSM